MAINVIKKVIRLYIYMMSITSCMSFITKLDIDGEKDPEVPHV